ncbi:MAG: cytidine deaminase [Lachnospiraceae bacterium]|nr:cytidine deaminase [Lachnospiraceae bacterium]
MEGKKIERLAEEALKARSFSYVPYSGFAVGAALLTAQGEIITGCNIENSSYSATNCAERTAIFKAVSEGKKDFAAIAVAGGRAGEMPEDFCPPCGICRQVLSEFCSPDLYVYLIKSEKEIRCCQLKDLLPMAFHLDKD